MIEELRNTRHSHDELAEAGAQREHRSVPAAELAVFVDLGVSNAKIAHYFGVEQEKVLALRSYYGLSKPEKVPAIEAE